MTKPGVIEFGLRSSSRRYTLRKGESTIINCTQDDVRLFPALRGLGLVITDYVEAQPTVVEPVTQPEPEPVETPVETVVEEVIDVPVESVDEPVTEELEVPEYDEKKLSSLTKAKLLELAESLGIEVPDSASKKEIVALILNDR